MTAAVARSSASLAVPQSQNTAPVHEYRCLYSHDIRRKQKRWQDGIVKFHTFNKRVMVYDEGRNFLGDTHWKEQGELQVDDEVTLDMGILVQVGDILATSQTNLAPLFERERQRPEEGDGLSTAARVALGGKANAAPRTFQKHKSLNALLGIPKGMLGRSTLPAKSPYEMRNANNENEWEDSQNVKRRKVDQPWTVTRMSKEMPLWARTSDARKGLSQKSKSKTPLAGQRSLVVTEVVDITSDNEGVPTSDVTLPSTPAWESIARAVPKSKGVAKTPAPRLPKPKITPRRDAPSSPPVSARNHLKPVDTGTTVENTRSRDTEATVKDASLPDTEEIPEQQRLKPAPKAKPLRIAKSQPRSMLLCQKPTTAPAAELKTSRNPQKSVNNAKVVEPEAELTLLSKLIASRRRVDPLAGLSDSDDDVGLSNILPKKAQPITTDRTLPHASISRPVKSRTAVLASDGTNRSSSPAFSTLPPRAEHFEPLVNSAAPASLPLPTTKRRQRMPVPVSESSDIEIMHGFMDQQLLTTSNAHAQVSKPAPLAFIPQLKPTAKPPFLPPPKPAIRASLLPPSKPTVESPFRRVQSESNAEPDIGDPDFSQIVDENAPVAAVLRPSQERMLKKASAPTKRATRKPLQRSMSLATSTTEKSKSTSRGKGKQVEKVPEKKVEMGPWTIEATDLFDWRPPDWEDRVKRRQVEFGY